MGALIECWFDGVCEPKNPGGHGAYGFLVKIDGREEKAAGGYVGCGAGISNNVAEYAGVCAVLDFLLYEKLSGPVIIRGDSKLVIMQLSGKWKVHGGHYVPMYRKAKSMLEVLRERIQGNVKLVWIPRALNDECDRHSKAVLHRMGIRFRIQPESPPLPGEHDAAHQD